MDRSPIVKLMAFALLASAALLGLLNIVDIVSSPLAADPVEGAVLAAQVALRDGIGPYEPEGWTREPYRINPYGPVFYHAGALMLGLWSGVPTLAAGRAISVVSLVGALLCAWLIARRHLRLSREATAIGMLVPLAFLPVWEQGALNRVDSLAACLSIAGVLLAMEGGWRLRTAPLFFALALMTKQTALAAPVTVLLWLAVEKRWKDLAWVGGATAALISVAVAGFQITTRGGFLLSLVESNRNPMHLQGGLGRLQLVFSSAAAPLFGGVGLTMSRSPRTPAGKAGLYLVVAMVIAAATIGKVGASVNYFIEAAMAMSVVAAWAWEVHVRRGAAASLALAVSGAMLIVALKDVTTGMAERGERRELEAQVSEALRGRRALTPEITSLLRSEGRLLLSDPYLFTRMVEAGRIDQRPLLEAVINRRIPVVLADADLASGEPSNLWTAELKEAVRSEYRLERRLGPRLYLFRPATDEPVHAEQTPE